MLSLNEDGFDDNTQYFGPQHSTPVKSQHISHSDSASVVNSKGNLTVSRPVSRDRGDSRVNHPSSYKTSHCNVHINDKCSTTLHKCSHIAQHFIPNDSVDVSQIPPLEGSQKKSYAEECSCSSHHKVSSSCVTEIKSKEGMVGELNTCSVCAKQITELQNGRQRLSKCKCFAITSFPSPLGCEEVYRSDSSSGLPHCNGHCHHSSEASLAALTSGCYSPGWIKSCSHSHASRNTSRPGRQSPLSPYSKHSNGCCRRKIRSHSVPRARCSSVNICNHSTEFDDPTISIADFSKAPPIFLDNDIISKQREEIQLLMEELAGRDQELNDLVTSHQKQVRAWEADRDKLNSLHARLNNYEEGLKIKERELRETLDEMGRVQDQKESDMAELSRTRADMVRLAERINENSNYIQEIEHQNKSLNSTIKDLHVEKERLEDRERDLNRLLELSKSECEEHQAAAKKMAERIQNLESQLETTVEKCNRRVQEQEAWKTKFLMEKDEAQKLAADCDSKDLSMAKMAQQLQESLQQAVALQKALFTSCEREKCKEEVLHSLRKQHKRTMQELANIRELYDLQTHDITKRQIIGTDPDSEDSKQIKSERSSISGKDEFLELASVALERRTKYRSRRHCHGDSEGGNPNSLSTDLSDSRGTDTAEIFISGRNTCQSSVVHNSSGTQSIIALPVGQSLRTSPTRLQTKASLTRSSVTSAAGNGPGLSSRPASSFSATQPEPKAVHKGDSQPSVSQLNGHQAEPLSQKCVHLHAYPSSSKGHHSQSKQLMQREQHQPCTCCQIQDQSQQSRQHSSDQSHYSTASSTMQHEAETTSQELSAVQRQHHNAANKTYKSHHSENSSAKTSSPQRQSLATELKSQRKTDREQEQGSLSQHVSGISSVRISPTKTRDVTPMEDSERRREYATRHVEENNVKRIYHGPIQPGNNNVSVSKARNLPCHEISENKDGARGSKNLKGSSVRSNESSTISEEFATAGTETVEHVSPRRTRMPKQRETRQQTEVPTTSVVNEDCKKQGSFVIYRDVAQAKKIEDYHIGKKDLKNIRNRGSGDDYEIEDSPQFRKDSMPRTSQRDVKRQQGAPDPSICISVSDISNLPSPSRYDDELTPADSDGMCRELNRDFKKISGKRLLSKDKPSSKLSVIPEASKSQQSKCASHSSNSIVEREKSNDREPSTKENSYEEIRSRKNTRKHESNQEESFASTEHRVQKEPDKKAVKQEYSVEECSWRSDMSGQGNKNMQSRKSKGHAYTSDKHNVFDRGIAPDKRSSSEKSSRQKRENSPDNLKCDRDDNCDISRSMKKSSYPDEGGYFKKEDDLGSERKHKYREISPDNMRAQVKSNHYPYVSPRSDSKSRSVAATNTTNEVSSHINGGRSYNSPTHLHHSSAFSNKHNNFGVSAVGGVTRMSPTKSVGGSYTSTSDAAGRYLPSSGLTTTCSTGSGLTRTSGYSGRRYMTHGVNSYLASRRSALYQGAESRNYALNNNNNDLNNHGDSSRDGDFDYEDEDDDNEDMDVASLSTRYSGNHLLNKNNNTSYNSDDKCDRVGLSIADDLTETGQIDDVKNKPMENLSNNNSCEWVDEITSIDWLLERHPENVSNRTEEKNEEKMEQNDSVDSVYNADKCEDSPQSSLQEPVIEQTYSKPFTTRSQSSLYRQLAQIHFCEKTRRYEWVVAPPHLEHLEKKPESDTRDSAQSSTTTADDSDEEPELGNHVPLVSKPTQEPASMDHHPNDVVKNVLSTVISESCLAFASSSHSDSGLFSLSYGESLHAGAQTRDKILNVCQPAPFDFPSHQIDSCCKNESSEDHTKNLFVAHSRDDGAHCKSHQTEGETCLRDMAKEPCVVTVVTCCVTPTMTSSVVLNSNHFNKHWSGTEKDNSPRDVTTPTHNTDVMLNSFMGVWPSQPARVFDGPTRAANSPSKKKSSENLTSDASSLDDVVKKLSFDDTSLESNLDQNSCVGEALNENKADLDSVHIELRSPNHQSVFNDLSIKSEKTSKCVPDLYRVRCPKEASSAHTIERNIVIHNCDGHNNQSDVTDFHNVSLSEYFQDISSLSAESRVETPTNFDADNKFNAVKTVVESDTDVFDSFGERMKSGAETVNCHVHEDMTKESNILKLKNSAHDKESYKDNFSKQIANMFSSVSSLQPQNCARTKTPAFDQTDIKFSYDPNVGPDGYLVKAQAWTYKDSVEEAAEQFDEKLSIFLEESSLNKTKPSSSFQMSPPPPSPATKLHQLLLESQQLVWALERSSAVPEALRSGVTHF